jgi:hypothetical protein
VSLSPMEVRKSPRKAVASRKSRESVVEIDGEEFVVATEKKKVARKNRVVKDEEEEEEEDVKPLVGRSKKRLLGKVETEEEEEEKLPVSRKKGKVSVQENDHLDADRLSDGFEARGGEEEEKDVELVKEEEEEDGGLAVLQDDDTQLSGFQTQDTEEGDVLETQERRIRPRVRAVFVTFMFYECFLYLNCSIMIY